MVERGISQARDPRVSGALVGAVGGSAFVLANRGALPAPWPTVALLAWLVALAAWTWCVLLRPRTLPPPRPPRPRAGAVYVGSVLAMVVLVVLASRALVALERPGLVPAAVATAVGLHFLPFARAFHARVFTTIGWSMAVVGAAGVVVGLAGAPGAGPAAAVVSGLLLTGLVALDAARTPRP